MPPLPRGTCPFCSADVALRNGGLVREHKTLGGINVRGVCPGSGKESVERAGERCKFCHAHHDRVPEDLCERARAEYDEADKLLRELVGDRDALPEP